MKKKNKLKIILILIIIIFLIFFFSMQNIEKNIYHINLITDKIVNINGYSFSLSDLDLTATLIFQDNNFFINSLQSNQKILLNKYKQLFNIQYEGLKSYLTSYLIKNKELYKFTESSLNQFYYNKTRLEVIMYDSEFLGIKRSNLIGDKNIFQINTILDNYKNLNFEESIENYLYFITKMFQSMDDLNKLYNYYREYLAKIYQNLNLDFLFSFYSNLFNIKLNGDIKISFEILPVIYKSIKLENSITSGSFDIAEYEKDFISYSFYNPYIALSLNIINNKSLATQYFIYGIINLIHSSSSNHKISEIKDKPNFFNNKVPDNLSDLSSWNSFLSSFKDYNEDNILFLDSIFTMQYLMENLKQKEPEFYQKLLENSTIYENSANVMEENWLKENKKNDIFHFLFYQYVSYCQDEKSPILFYSQGFDMDSLFNETINECNTSKNNTNNNASSNISKDKAKLYNFAKVLYNFAYNKFYLQRIQILKTINRANKYFYPFLSEQQY